MAKDRNLSFSAPSTWEDIEKWQAADPAANKFDLIVIGGGTFGAYLADKVASGT